MSNDIQVALRMDGTSQVQSYQDYVASTVEIPYMGEVAPAIIEAQPPTLPAGLVFRVLNDQLFVVDPGSPPQPTNPT